MRPVTILKDTIIGKLEAVELVTVGDPDWEEQQSPLVSAVNDGRVLCEWKRLLEEYLCIGKYNDRNRAPLLKMILSNNNRFA